MSACSGRPLSTISLALIGLYRFSLAGLLGGQCRFYPTCSSYAEDALRAHGFLAGWTLALKRIGRCHPWHAGGYDPVPLAGHCRVGVSEDTRIASSR